MTWTSDATDGRIPDPVTPARLADEEKVEVFDRDGNSVKMTREEFDAQSKARNAEDAPEA